MRTTILVVLILAASISALPLFTANKLTDIGVSADIFPETNEHGFIPVGNDGDDIFYWYFPSRNNAETAPLVMWLTGGPGCSSELAIFYENGPMKLQDGKVITNEFSWNNKANLIYIDQPVGTG